MEFDIAAQFVHPLRIIDYLTYGIRCTIENTVLSMDKRDFTLVSQLIHIFLTINVCYTLKSDVSWSAVLFSLTFYGLWRNVCLFLTDRINEQEEIKAREEANRPTNSTFRWINKVIRLFHKTHRAQAAYTVRSMWPEFVGKIEGWDFQGTFDELNLANFDVGEVPPTIDKISVFDSKEDGSKDIVMDVHLRYRGNAFLTVSLKRVSNNLAFPFTIKDISVGNAKLRIVFKKIRDMVPFVSGIQVFFLEIPDLDWHYDNTAKILGRGKVHDFVKSQVEKLLLNRYVMPNSLTHPISLPRKMKVMMRKHKVNMNILRADFLDIVLPAPSGIIYVSPMKAENHQYIRAKPLLGEGKPHIYVKATIGQFSFKSTEAKDFKYPVWSDDFEFPMEYHKGAKLSVSIISSKPNIIGYAREEVIGKITETVDRIKEKAFIEDWYNFQVNQGKIQMRLQWRPLRKRPPIDRTASMVLPGYLCLAVGRLEASKDILKPKIMFKLSDCHTNPKRFSMVNDCKCLFETDVGKPISKSVHTINFSRTLRVIDLQSKGLTLHVQVRDSKHLRYLKEISVTDLLENPLNGPILLGDSECSIIFTVRSKVLYEEVPYAEWDE